VADITADNQRVMWDKLKGVSSPKHSYANPLHLKLRAQFNPQRHYEIYIFDAVEGISENEIREMFESDPQTAADTIRRVGHCFYSDRATQNDKIVIR
jgi:hypothetical protein